MAPQQRVAEREQQVAQANEAEQRPHEDAHREPQHHQRTTKRERKRWRERSGGDGPEALARVTPILLGVADVVDAIDPG